MSVEQVLAELKEAGLDSMPGGGAEIFAKETRDKIIRGKANAEQWLDVMREAHRQGIPTNATMLYGHIESVEDRVDHLVRLRELQDETGGFVTYIPLAFQPWEAPAMKCPETTGFEDLKAIAVGRLMLDNFPHIKSYWIMIGAAPGPGRPLLRGRRHRRHGHRGEDRPRRGRPHAAGHDRARARAPDPRGRPPSRRARHGLQRGQGMVSVDGASRLARWASVSYLTPAARLRAGRTTPRFDAACGTSLAGGRAPARGRDRPGRDPLHRVRARRLRDRAGRRHRQPRRRCAPCASSISGRWRDVRRVALDPSSRTSVALLQGAAARAPGPRPRVRADAADRCRPCWPRPTPRS